MRRRLLIAGLAVVLTAAAVATVLALKGDNDTISQRDESAVVPTGPIRFVLNDSYEPGEKVNVKIRNVGGRGFRYQSFYAACFLRYFDSSGREFKVPPGTHCDILHEATIKPGEIVELFTWRLNECVKDRWGCVKSRPLPPGTYSVRGSFKSFSGKIRARPEATFRIVEA